MENKNNVATMLNAKMPLRDLLAMVPEKPAKVYPNRKTLRDKHIPIAVYTSKDYIMQVFENGFALVESFKRWTVVCLSDCCGEYHYKSDVPMVDNATNFAMVVPEDLLMEQPWTIRVAMTGEDQLERNNDILFAQLIWRHAKYAQDKKYTLGGYYTFEDILLHRMELQEALMKLTDKQIEVIQRCIFAGYTQKEAAEMLGISQAAVKNRLEGGLKKLRRLLTE